MTDAPIGIFDSGSGGLSIYETLERELSNESYIYIGDHANLPYANKKAEEIHSRVFRLIEFFLARNVKAIVIACNTATVAGIELYRSRFPRVPILGVVPVVKTAAEVTKSNKILVLSTPFTTASEYQKKLIASFATDKQVYSVGCPELVPLIEKGIISGHEVKLALQNTIEPYLEKGADVIVLGCTHYPFLLPTIRDILKKKDVLVLDSSGAVMRQLKRVLFHNGIEAKTQHGTSEFFTTGEAETISKVSSFLLKKEIHFNYVNV
ncbi:glutamate racemase [Candidatus Gottesmanbacteria bacterium]|nr:glutamate racemase [Candidatus Gottesmanbacteria bacterium]